MKKILTILGTAFLSFSMIFAQAANDGFLVPIDEDLTDAITKAAAPQGAASGPSLMQGIWIEATSQTDFLIRDIATGEVSGFEVDENHFKSNVKKKNFI